jgi:hypothetical protein
MLCKLIEFGEEGFPCLGCTAAEFLLFTGSLVCCLFCGDGVFIKGDDSLVEAVLGE